MRKLKPSLLLGILLALAVTTAHARPARNRRGARNKHIHVPIKFGAKVGYCGAFLHSRTLRNIEDHILLRPRFDLYGEYELNDTLGVQLSLMYLGQGVKDPYAKLYLDYILCSPSLRWYPGSDRQLCLFLGPQLSYLMSAKEVQSSSNNSINLLQDSDSEQRRRIDAGLLFGLDYEFDIKLLLGVSWNVGFISIVKNSNLSLTNFSGSWYLGYNFAPLLLQ